MQNKTLLIILIVFFTSLNAQTKNILEVNDIATLENYLKNAKSKNEFLEKNIRNKIKILKKKASFNKIRARIKEIQAKKLLDKQASNSDVLTNVNTNTSSNTNVSSLEINSLKEKTINKKESKTDNGVNINASQTKSPFENVLTNKHEMESASYSNSVLSKSSKKEKTVSPEVIKKSEKKSIFKTFFNNLFGFNKSKINTKFSSKKKLNSNKYAKKKYG